MKLAFKIAVFAFVLNLASAIIIFSVPSFGDEYLSVIKPIADQTSGQNLFVEGLGGNVTLPSTTQGTENIKDILLDSLLIGKIIKFVSGVKTVLFGFPQMIYNALLVFTPASDIGWLGTMRGVLYTIVGLCYALGIFYLWTNKEINK